MIVKNPLLRIKNNEWLSQKETGRYGEREVFWNRKREEKIGEKKWALKNEEGVDLKKRKVALRNQRWKIAQIAKEIIQIEEDKVR